MKVNLDLAHDIKVNKQTLSLLVEDFLLTISYLKKDPSIYTTSYLN